MGTAAGRLAWLGSVQGHRTIPLGVEHFGQTGTIGDLYNHFGISAESIVQKVGGLTVGPRMAQATWALMPWNDCP